MCACSTTHTRLRGCFIHAGGQDTLSNPKDVELLLEAFLPGTVKFHHHEPDYAHLDFELGSDVHQTVYPLVLQYLDASRSARHNVTGAEAAEVTEEGTLVEG